MYSADTAVPNNLMPSIKPKCLGSGSTQKSWKERHRAGSGSQTRLAHATQDAHAAFYSMFHLPLCLQLFFPPRLCIQFRSDLVKHWSVKLNVTTSQSTPWETGGKKLMWLSFKNSENYFSFPFLPSSYYFISKHLKSYTRVTFSKVSELSGPHLRYPIIYNATK